jgi:hypothetical protein
MYGENNGAGAAGAAIGAGAAAGAGAAGDGQGAAGTGQAAGQGTGAGAAGSGAGAAQGAGAGGGAGDGAQAGAAGAGAAGASGAASASAGAGAGAGAGDAAGQGAAADWRKDLAGGDDKLQKHLERYTTLKDAIAAGFALKQDLSSGKYKRAEPPANATPEQLTAWRTENGLPAEGKGYLEGLPQGLVIGDDDKPIFESLANHLHAKNADPKYVHETIAWYNQFQQQEEARVQAADAENAKATEAALKTEWGADYQANVTLRAALIATAPAEVQEALKTARLADGTLLGEHPHISRWLVGLQREINPAATLMPTGMDNVKAVSDEIANFEKMMGDTNSDYWRGPKAEANQARYRELVSARDKLKARAA